MGQSRKHIAIVLMGIIIAVSAVIVRAQSAPKSQPPPRIPSSVEDQDEAEVIRVDTNLVNTVFTAVDKDRHFVTTLNAGDVRIFENNVAQSISMFERETSRPLTLAILVDTSESQRGVLTDEKGAARTFVDSVIRPDKDRAAIISFTGDQKIEQGLTGDRAQLNKGIERVRIELSPENARRLANGDDPLPKDQDPSGYTGIWDALWMAMDDILAKTPTGTRRAVILLSDGDDTSSTIKRQDVIDLAVKSDVVIYSIGIRDRDFPEGKLDSSALKKISDRTGGRAFFPLNKDELQRAFAQIDQELRSQYLIAYSPTNMNRDGAYRQIRVEVINPALRDQKVQLLYRTGYYARKN